MFVVVIAKPNKGRQSMTHATGMYKTFLSCVESLPQAIKNASHLC